MCLFLSGDSLVVRSAPILLLPMAYGLEEK